MSDSSNDQTPRYEAAYGGAVEALSVAQAAARAADSKKAQDIVVLDVTELSDMSDYLVICTTTSNPQTQAVLEEVKDQVSAQLSEKPFSIEGRESGHWILLDYGAVIVHIFQQDLRDYYRLEKLWGDAPQVQF